jgi:hypothetical protein
MLIAYGGKNVFRDRVRPSAKRLLDGSPFGNAECIEWPISKARGVSDLLEHVTNQVWIFHLRRYGQRFL